MLLVSILNCFDQFDTRFHGQGKPFFRGWATAFAQAQFVQFQMMQGLKPRLFQGMARAVQRTSINGDDMVGLLGFQLGQLVGLFLGGLFLRGLFLRQLVGFFVRKARSTTSAASLSDGAYMAAALGLSTAEKGKMTEN